MQVEYRKRLVFADSLLQSDPKRALDSLQNFRNTLFSSENKAYYYLLLTIANDKNDVLDDDSLISVSIDFYKDKRDYYNYARSLTYKAIIRYINNNRDTSSFELFKTAEKIYVENDIKDKRLLGNIYTYIGRINKADGNFELAQDYFLKALNFYKTNNNIDNYIISIIDIIWIKINLKDYKNIPPYIKLLEETDNIPQYFLRNLYNTYAVYYASILDYNKAIDFTRKNIALNTQNCVEPNQCYSLSAYYLKLGQLDSSIHYAERSIMSIKDSIASNNYHYYKHLADMYRIGGNYKSASDYYFKAYQFHQRYLEEVSSKKILELEKRYNVQAKDLQLSISDEKNRFLKLVVIGISITSILLLVIFWFRVKISRKELEIRRHKEEIKAQIAESKLKKQRVINNLMKISTALLPEITNDYLKIANNKYSLSPELYEDLIKLNKRYNNEYRKNINSVINSELIEILDYLPLEFVEQLSTNEKLVLFLTEEGYSTSQIAEILNNTANSVRTSKMRLLQKINDATLYEKCVSLGLRIVSNN